jgi:hypothetical protein
MSLSMRFFSDFGGALWLLHAVFESAYEPLDVILLQLRGAYGSPQP